MKEDFNFAHLLTISRFKTIAEYFVENFKDIDKRYYKQFAISGAVSLLLTPAVIIEDLVYGRKETKEPVKEPVFVMGHWRSGTTLVQYILSRDKQFGIINPRITYTLNFYHTFGGVFAKLLPPLLEAGRAMDNLKYAMDLPLEEYVVMSTFESHGAYPINFFPKAFKRYAQNAFVDRLPEKQKKRWMKNYDNLLRKTTYLNDGKRLILKSPDATARMKFMREMYPDAKFINIYRNPYTVIRSTKHLYDKIFELWALEEIPGEEELEDMIIDTFKEMYEAYFEEIKSFPEDTLYEVKFEDFEKDALPYMEEMYKQLGLGDYEKCRKDIEDYWATFADYKKNDFDYPERLMKKVNEKLGFYFEHYGYEMKEV